MTGVWALVLASAGMASGEDVSALLSGTFTNEEQVYFEKDAGKTPPPWMSLNLVKEDGQLWLRQTDAYGQEGKKAAPVTFSAEADKAVLKVGHCTRNFDRDGAGWKYSMRQNRMACQQEFQITNIGTEGLSLRFADGRESNLKRARPVQCWAAVPKRKKKEDGSIDWHFARQLNMHDQGGRVRLGGGETGADEVILRMRAVHWPPPSTNRPSMVLYVHKPDKPDSAVSYSWADINASRVGLNLRWMQASCTIEGAERSSEVSKDNFRG